MKPSKGYLNVYEYARRKKTTANNVWRWVKSGNIEFSYQKTRSGTRYIIIPENAEPNERTELVPPECPALRCVNNTNGICEALTECLFNRPSKPGCPFYKRKEDRK